MANIILDIGHLTADSFSSSPDLQQDFAASFRNRRSPVTLALTSDTQLHKIEQIAKQIRADYEDVLLLGIGGSALGARAIISFIHGPFYNLKPAGPRLFILDNLDPMVVRATEAQLNLKKTCLIYVSKSGSTPETAATFMYFAAQVQAAGGSLKDTVIICDPGDNGINHLAEELGARVLHLPAQLPGRYSVLSAAGLLPAAITGVNIQQLVLGAWSVHQSVTASDAISPVLLLGEQLFALQKQGGKNIHVLFNYASTLAEFGLWYMQLWAESLGKKHSLSGEIIHTGSTPLSCVGATDQHSLLQLFKEGPADKVYGFIDVQDQGEPLTVPELFSSEKEYAYLTGHSLQHQLATEQMATQISLINTGHPCYQITLTEHSPAALGALFYFYQVLVAYIACLGDINAFDQPGVEEGKNITYSLLGRADYQQQRDHHIQQVKAFQERSRRQSI